MSLRREVGHGLFWVAVATVGSKGLAMLRQIVLARLLYPKDFGLVAYAALAIGVLDLFKEMGFSSALIYRRDSTEEAADTSFIFEMISGVVLYGVAWLSAPLAARFFRNPALVQVLRVLALTLVISAVSQVPGSLLAKGMGFKKKVIPEIISGMVGLVISVGLALLSYGVWSIVYGQVLTSVMMSILVWFFCPWRPRFRFSWRMAKELWSYGRHIVGSQLMVFLITNIDNAFVGRFLGDAALGTYQVAFNLSNLPATHLSRIVGQVMFPAFSKMQDDLGRLRQVFFQSMKYVSLIAFPVSVITMVFARDFIDVAYGGRWYWAVIPLQWLTIYGLARSIAVNMGNVFKAGGKPKWLLYVATLRLTMMAALLYPAIKLVGVNGVAGLSAGVAIFDFFLSMYLTNRILHASWKQYARTLLPMLGVSLMTTLLAHRVYAWTQGLIHPFIGLPAAGGLALALYLGIMYGYDPHIRLLVWQTFQGLLQEFRRRRMAPSQTRA